MNITSQYNYWAPSYGNSVKFATFVKLPLSYTVMPKCPFFSFIKVSLCLREKKHSFIHSFIHSISITFENRMFSVFNPLLYFNVKTIYQHIKTVTKMYSKDLKLWLVRISNGQNLNRGWVANGLDIQWDLKSASPTIWNTDKWQLFCQKPFTIWTKIVPILNGWDYSNSHS